MAVGGLGLRGGLSGRVDWSGEGLPGAGAARVQWFSPPASRKGAGPRELALWPEREEGSAGSAPFRGLLEGESEALGDAPPGPWSLALWDAGRGALGLAADGLGLGAVFYRREGSSLSFSTDLRDLLEGEVAFDREALAHFLAYLSSPSGRTLLSGVRRVRPGRMLWLAAREEKEEPFSSLPSIPSPRRAFDAARMLREILSEAVRENLERLPEGGKPGLLLSGGFDSSVLLALIRRHYRGPLLTLCAADPGSPDLRYARRVAASFRSDHREVTMEAGEVPALAREVVEALGGPSGNSSNLLLARAIPAAREAGVGLLFSGLGGDEAFAGHGKHLLAPLWRWERRLPGALGRAALRLGVALAGAGSHWMRIRRAGAVGGPAERSHLELYRSLPPRRLAELLPGGEEMGGEWGGESGEASWAESYGGRIMGVDFDLWLRGNLALALGAFALRSGLALALPFCHPGVLGFAAGLPFHYKVRGGTGKWLLRRSFAGLVPEEVLLRVRQGFSLPMGEWMAGPLAEDLWGALGSGRLGALGLDPKGVAALFESHRRGEGKGGGEDYSEVLWALWTLSLWAGRLAGAGDGR